MGGKIYQDHLLNKDWNPYLKKQVQAGMNLVGTYLNNVDAMANNVAARTWWQNTASANDQSWQHYAINTLNKAHEAFSPKAPVDHYRQAQNQMAVNAARLNAIRSAAMTHAILNNVSNMMQAHYLSFMQTPQQMAMGIQVMQGNKHQPGFSHWLYAHQSKWYAKPMVDLTSWMASKSTQQAVSNFNYYSREEGSVVLDMLPGVGAVKSSLDFECGEDVITGAPESHLSSAIDLGLNFFPAAGAVAKGVGKGFTAAREAFGLFGSGELAEIVPDLGRPFRAENSLYPANVNIVDYMNDLPIDSASLDCSEITDRLYSQGGEVGSKLRITPKDQFGLVTVPERINGSIEGAKYDYHYVYQERGYVYDPRVSSTAIPKGDYFKLVRQYNPSGFLLEEEIDSMMGTNYRNMKP